MANAIPVYRICTLPGSKFAHENILVDRLERYLRLHPDIRLPHRHSFYHLVLFTKGGGTHSIDFKEYPVVPGQIYFMSPGQVHGWLFNPSVNGYVVHFETDFFSNWANHRYLQQFPMLKSHLAQQVIQLNKPAYAMASDMLEQAIIEYNSNNPFRKDMLQILLAQLLITVSREIQTTHINVQLSHKDEIVQQFTDLVEHHYANWKHPKKYAMELNISANYLNQVCNQVTGNSAGRIIRERQILEAKRLLTNITLSIKEISVLLNFKDNSYFSKFFKRHCNLSPEEFRQKL